jgi:Fe-S-cluster-containing dehydrogenase component
MNKLEGPFILVDTERCVGCHAYEIACAVAHTNAELILCL